MAFDFDEPGAGADVGVRVQVDDPHIVLKGTGGFWFSPRALSAGSTGGKEVSLVVWVAGIARCPLSCPSYFGGAGVGAAPIIFCIIAC